MQLKKLRKHGFKNPGAFYAHLATLEKMGQVQLADWLYDFMVTVQQPFKRGQPKYNDATRVRFAMDCGLTKSAARCYMRYSVLPE